MNSNVGGKRFCSNLMSVVMELMLIIMFLVPMNSITLHPKVIGFPQVAFVRMVAKVGLLNAQSIVVTPINPQPLSVVMLLLKLFAPKALCL